MAMRRYKVGLDRRQEMLLPSCADDYVSQTNVVRAIEAYADSLDLHGFGVTNTGADSGKGGQPAYPPAMLLKLYLYGYFNRIRSSRLLERETQRNIELMWLLQNMKPSHMAISDFRKNNIEALKKTNRDFVSLCRELNLYGGEEVGIDGTFMSGNASKGSIHTKEKLEKQLEKAEKSVDNYFKEPDEKI